MAYSALFTWVYLHTRGSVLIATLLHGAINFSQGLFLGGIEPAREYWLLPAVYGVAVLVLVAGSRTEPVAEAPGASRGSRQRRCTRKRDLRSSLALRAARLRPTRFPC
jgi:hypothetical protein